MAETKTVDAAKVKELVPSSLNLYAATITAMVSAADDMSVTVGLEIGFKVSDAGKPSPVYATTRIACKEHTVEGALKALDALGDKAIKVSIPAITSGRIKLTLQPVMSAAKFAAFCRQ